MYSLSLDGEIKNQISKFDPLTIDIANAISDRIFDKFCEEYLIKISQLNRYKIAFTETQLYFTKYDKKVDIFINDIFAKLKRNQKPCKKKEIRKKNNENFGHFGINKEIDDFGFSKNSKGNFNQDLELSYQDDQNLVSGFSGTKKAVLIVIASVSVLVVAGFVASIVSVRLELKKSNHKKKVEENRKENIHPSYTSEELCFFKDKSVLDVFIGIQSDNYYDGTISSSQLYFNKNFLQHCQDSGCEPKELGSEEPVFCPNCGAYSDEIFYEMGRIYAALNDRKLDKDKNSFFYYKIG